MCGIDVEITDHGPAVFEVRVQQPGSGESYVLPREHEDTLEIEELAYGRLLSDAVRPLPAGAIRVRITEERPGHRPPNQEVADQVARLLAEHEGGWSTWA